LNIGDQAVQAVAMPRREQEQRVPVLVADQEDDQKPG